MKQISYEIDWATLTGALVASLQIEDGFWQININTESVSSMFPAPVVGASPIILPGHIVRITGLRLTKVPDLGFMCVEVKNGLITEVDFGANTNQCGSI